MQSGYFFLVWACAGYLCLFQREINIFVQKEKKDPHRFRDGFFGREISVQVSDGKRKWSSRMASRRFRVTYSTDRTVFWRSEYLSDTYIVICIENEPINRSYSLTHTLYRQYKKRVYITKRGGDESLILDRQQISTGPPPENNFNGFDCYGILGIIQVFTHKLLTSFY